MPSGVRSNAPRVVNQIVRGSISDAAKCNRIGAGHLMYREIVNVAVHHLMVRRGEGLSIAAVQQNFPAYDIYFAGNTDLIVIATTAPSVPTPDWRVMDWPMMSDDLHSVQALSGNSLAALEIADWRTLSPLVSVVRANSDFAPVLDLSGEKARYPITFLAAVHPTASSAERPRCTGATAARSNRMA